MNSLHRLRSGSALLLWASLALPCAALDNGGFEQTRVPPESEWVVTTLREKAWETDHPVVLPVGWHPNPLGREGVFHLIRDPAQSQAGTTCVEVRGDLAADAGFKVNAGDQVQLSFWARDPLRKPVYGVLYAYGKRPDGQPVGLGDALCYAAIPGAEWTRCTGTITILDELAGTPVSEVIPVIRAPAGARIDEVECTVIAAPPTPPVAPEDAADRLNHGFERWDRVDTTPAGWDVPGNLFPRSWTVEGRPGEKGSLRRFANPPEARARFGEASLFLNGKILSKRVLQGLEGKTLQVSFWARGGGGFVTCRARQYGSPFGTELTALVDLLRVAATDEWREYTATVVLSSFPHVRLEVEGRGVLLDEIGVLVLDPATAPAAALPPMILTIPVSERPVQVDGKVGEGEWRDAIDIRNGFIDIATHAAVWRQTEWAVSADREKLYLLTRVPPRPNGIRNTVTQRDGKVWEDESVELYLNPTPDEKVPPAVYQFVVNAGGAVFDRIDKRSIGQSEVAWNCPGLQVGSGVQDGAWVLELAVPLAEVGVTAAKPWGMQVARTLLYPQEFSTLNGAGYQDYAAMIRCSLAATAPAVRWGYGGNLKDGKLDLVAEVSNRLGEPASYRLALRLAGALAKEEVQTLRLASGATGEVTLSTADAPVKSGVIQAEVSTPDGVVLFSQRVPISTADVPAPAAATAGDTAGRIEFYPVQGKVNIRLENLSGRAWAKAGQTLGTAEVCIYRGDRRVARETVAQPRVVADTAHLTVPFAPTEDGTYEVQALVNDSAGNGIELISGTIEKAPLPWRNNALGKDRKVIPPFTPLQAHGRDVACWGRQHRFAGSALPESIVSGGQAVLSAPIALVLQTAAGTLTGQVRARDLEVNERAPDRVMFQGRTTFPGLAAELVASMDYDGMVRYQLALLPSGDVAVQRLALEIPVRDGRYAHVTGGMRSHTNVWLLAPPPEGEYRDPNAPAWAPGWSYAAERPHALYFPAGDGVVWSSFGLESPRVQGNFVPFVWVGNARTGIAWFANDDRGWVHDRDHACFEMVRSGADITLRANLVAAPTTLRAPLTFTFGLLATPVRPRLRGGNLAVRLGEVGFGNWFLEQAMGITYRDPYLAKQVVDRSRAHGIATHNYLANDLFPRADRAMRTLRNEWEQEPFGEYTQNLSSFPSRQYGPDADDYIAVQTCAQQSRVDYQVWCFAEALRQGAIDGVYMDNSYPNSCLNLQHLGCGYLRPDGTLQAGFHLFETRDLIRRTAVLASLGNALPPHVSVHMTSAMTIPCFSFADLCIDGEWDHAGRDFMDYFALPYLEVFAATDWGPNQGWLPKLHGLEGEIKPTRTLLAALKLYDLWIWHAYCNVALLDKLERLEELFGTTAPDCRFVGYWEREGGVSGLPVPVKASWYLRPGKGVLLYLANFARDAQEFDLKLAADAWQITSPQIVDAETRAVLGSGPAVRLAIEGHDFRVLLIQPERQP